MISVNIKKFIEKTKKLQGDPHYVSLGMAIGVFIGITPTMPFHTILALSLAYLFKASRPAAYIGIWFSNPFTMIFLYIACYKVGLLFFGHLNNNTKSVEMLVNALESDLSLKEKWDVFTVFVRTKARVFLIMNLGGLILGIPGGIMAYLVTRRIFIKIRSTV